MSEIRVATCTKDPPIMVKVDAWNFRFNNPEHIAEFEQAVLEFHMEMANLIWSLDKVCGELIDIAVDKGREFIPASMLMEASGLYSAIRDSGGDCGADLKEIVRIAREEIRDREQEKDEAHAERRQLKKRQGYVYLIKAENGLYKIGRSNDPANRRKTFGIKLPFKVDFEAIILRDDMVAAECELHERFKHRRVDGEWFDLSNEEVEQIKAMTNVDMGKYQ